MKNKTNPNTSLIAVGSIRDVAQANGQSEAIALMHASLVVCVDTSQSMTTRDAGTDKNMQRHDAAEAELRRLQAEYPGRIAVISFSDRAEFCLNGVATRFDGGTDLLPALELFEDLDGLADLVIVSDGEVADPNEVLSVARRLKSKIQTIFIGDKRDPNNKEAIAFLKKLASVNNKGGTFAETLQPGMLAAPVRLMLGAPKKSGGAIQL